MLKYLLSILLFSSQINLSAQTRSFEDTLIAKIIALQSKGSSAYAKGLFPSERIKRKEVRQDNNIFFTGIILLTLQSQYARLSNQNQIAVDSIEDKAIKNYDHYRNRTGDITYNFWQTKPEMFFPNDPRKSKRGMYRIPDDFDDTSILFLTSHHSDSLNKAVKNKFIEHTNLYRKKIRSTFKKYRNYKAYNTWFGKRMPLEFDVCVMANTLLFVFKSNQELNSYDRNTISLIEQMILDNEHIRHPYLISPNYQSTSIILYHLARLLAVAPSNEFEKIRLKVIADLKNQLYLGISPMEKLLIQSSLCRLGIPIDSEIDYKSLIGDFKNFNFFVANLVGAKPLWVKRLIGKSSILKYYYQCEAYYWVLILENHLLKKQFIN